MREVTSISITISVGITGRVILGVGDRAIESQLWKWRHLYVYFLFLSCTVQGRCAVHETYQMSTNKIDSDIAQQRKRRAQFIMQTSDTQLNPLRTS